MESFAVYVLLALAVSSSINCENVSSEKKASRRSIGEYHDHYDHHDHFDHHDHIGHYAPFHGHYPASYASHYAPYHAHSYHGHHHHHPVVYQSVVHAIPTATTVVHKHVPVPVPHPVPVPVVRPVPVEVPRPYPVPVNRPYPVHVIKPVPVPVAQPYPVTVYKPYPVPVYRPLPVAVAKPAVAVQYATRVPVRVPLRYYPHAPSYSYHGQAAIYAHRHAFGTAPTPAYAPSPAYAPAQPYPGQSAYLQQLLRGAQNEYEVNEPQSNEEDYAAFQGQHEASLALNQQHGNVEQDIDSRYPPLTNSNELSLGVPSTDYSSAKKK